MRVDVLCAICAVDCAGATCRLRASVSYSPRVMRAFVFSCALLNVSPAGATGSSVSNVKQWLRTYLMAPSTLYKDNLDKLLAETSPEVLTAVAKSMKLGCSVQEHVQRKRQGMLDN